MRKRGRRKKKAKYWEERMRREERGERTRSTRKRCSMVNNYIPELWCAGQGSRI